MRNHPDRDRRLLERFLLRAPAIVKATAQNGGLVAELYTRDICSRGAYFQTSHPFPPGVPVEITLFLVVSSFREWKGLPHSVKVKTDGTVVRSEGGGMAVAFGDQYQMVPVPA